MTTMEVEPPTPEPPKTSIGEPIKTSCERCRRRKIKCDRNQPCGKCAKANTECVRGTGEKQRPVSKSYVLALEAQVATLELFIRKVAAASPQQQDELLSSYVPSSAETPFSIPASAASAADKPSPPPGIDCDVVLARPKAGYLRKLRAGNASQFYGGTSLFQLHVSEDLSAALKMDETTTEEWPSESGLSPQNAFFQYAPHDEISQRMMATFFMMVYPYNMLVYREYFLRDYDTGSGKYYSDLLLYSICALGALVSDDPMASAISRVYASQAHTLLLSNLDTPDLCMLQALILLGHREIGQDNSSKGWLFCGMAFRLAHEMGLHLDPNNWGGPADKSVDCEILRRVYWAAFTVDKQLSLYFGRPPALYPQESDVRNTNRIPYPPGWEQLLDTYIAENTSVTAYKDGFTLIGSFILKAELAKITHSIITDIFENRRSNPDSSVVAAKARQAHSALIKWLSSLPGKLHWNQWTVGQIPPEVLHLHMSFHTLMIILHRPPHKLFSKPGIATSEDVEICYQSLQVIFRLMRSYSRYYDYRYLPLDFVHTLSTAAGTVLMKRFFEKSSWDDTEVTQNLTFLIEAMDAISPTWPCVCKIRDIVVSARSNPTEKSGLPFEDQLMFTELMDGLVDIPDSDAHQASGLSGLHNSCSIPVTANSLHITELHSADIQDLLPIHTTLADASLGGMVPDDVLGGQFSWDHVQPEVVNVNPWFLSG